ncbi:MAG: hypothetical protein R3B47_05955 [Bacteroidia bacterium]
MTRTSLGLMLSAGVALVLKANPTQEFLDRMGSDWEEKMCDV